jgi:hypothetical protein
MLLLGRLLHGVIYWSAELTLHCTNASTKASRSEPGCPMTSHQGSAPPPSWPVHLSTPAFKLQTRYRPGCQPGLCTTTMLGFEAVSRFLNMIETSDRDVEYVGELLAEIVNHECKEVILQLKGYQAEIAANTMQWVRLLRHRLFFASSYRIIQWLSKYTARDDLRRRVTSLLLELSTASGVFPEEFFIHGVNIGDKPVISAMGSYADIIRGEYNGQTVAVKRLRVGNADRLNFNPVCLSEHCRSSLRVS